MTGGKTLNLILTGGFLGGLAALGACGGDDGGGAEGTATVTAGSSSGDSGSATQSTTMSTSESATMTTTEADTSSSGGQTTMTTDPTEADSSSGGTPAAAAFRFNSVAVRDPHFFAPIVGDVTEGSVNMPLNMALNADGDGDGLFDLGFILAFDPLDQSDGGTGAVTFANVQCNDAADPTMCTLRPMTQEYPTTYTSQADGTCQAPNPDYLGPGYDPTPQSTTGPCFVTAGTSVSIATSSFALPMENATVAARYVGDPAGNLVEGSIIGFVSQAAADSAILMGTGTPFDGMPVSALLHDDAKDDGDTGWWFHIDFTAVPATY
ncbi:MAG: hypothetical protein K1X88_30575 [Nannocystaceae bacterium]|nr:hypothetical protein [Nannocystaceae bacterium]